MRGVMSGYAPSTGSGQALRPFDKLRTGSFDKLRANPTYKSGSLRKDTHIFFTRYFA